MNYSAHYHRLIARARSRTLTGYKERHHVLPRCMGGGNEPENLVDLTAEEHYVAHQLLVKMYPDHGGLATAAVRMANKCTGNKAYGWLRRRHAESRRGTKHPPHICAAISAAGKKRIVSAATREKLRLLMLGNKRAISQRGRKRGTPSLEHRKKLSDALRGYKRPPFSVEHRAKLSASNRVRKVSQETRAKMSASRHAYCERKNESLIENLA